MEFVYDSADAAGQNAVTVTTWYACNWAKERIAQECPDINIREYYIETKFSGDKNNIPKNYVTGRGIEVQAETYITESTLKSVLKVSECDDLTILYVSWIWKIQSHKKYIAFSRVKGSQLRFTSKA